MSTTTPTTTPVSGEALSLADFLVGVSTLHVGGEWEAKVLRASELLRSLTQFASVANGKWSFDDAHIGATDLDGMALKSRVFPKPDGMPTAEWWEVARNVCHYLNQAKVSTASPIPTTEPDHARG